MIPDDAIRALVSRLARPGADGGHVIERAAIFAAGPECAAVEAWIIARGGRPEAVARPRAAGLHSGTGFVGSDPAARRFLLPPGALASAAGAPLLAS